MRLFELSLPSSFNQAEQVLNAAGWEKIGEGFYASVYSKPTSSYVLKLFEYDTSYVAFIKMIKQHSSPHFPKIRGELRVTPTYYAARMEKLLPIQKVNVDGYTVDISGMMNAYMIEKRNQLNNIQIRDRELFDIYAADKPALVQALDLIDETLLDKFHLDISPQNIMQRADGTVVIIDPIYP